MPPSTTSASPFKSAAFFDNSSCYDYTRAIIIIPSLVTVKFVPTWQSFKVTWSSILAWLDNMHPCSRHLLCYNNYIRTHIYRWFTHPSPICTWSMMTQLSILLFSPIVQCCPMQECLIETLSPSKTPSVDTKQSPLTPCNNIIIVLPKMTSKSVIVCRAADLVSTWNRAATRLLHVKLH